VFFRSSVFVATLASALRQYIRPRRTDQFVREWYRENNHAEMGALLRHYWILMQRGGLLALRRNFSQLWQHRWSHGFALAQCDDEVSGTGGEGKDGRRPGAPLGHPEEREQRHVQHEQADRQTLVQEDALLEGDGKRGVPGWCEMGDTRKEERKKKKEGTAKRRRRRIASATRTCNRTRHSKRIMVGGGVRLSKVPDVSSRRRGGHERAKVQADERRPSSCERDYGTVGVVRGGRRQGGAMQTPRKRKLTVHLKKKTRPNSKAPCRYVRQLATRKGSPSATCARMRAHMCTRARTGCLAKPAYDVVVSRFPAVFSFVCATHTRALAQKKKGSASEKGKTGLHRVSWRVVDGLGSPFAALRLPSLPPFLLRPAPSQHNGP